MSVSDPFLFPTGIEISYPTLRSGARIDHMLYTRPWRCVRSFVADEIGSDHLPLVADFVLD